MNCKALLRAAIVAVTCAALSACSLLGAGRSLFQPSSRVLFIGNSFTSYNEGVDQQLKHLDPSIEVESVTVGGYTLQDHWNAGVANQAIQSRQWDYVIMQEQSQTPVSRPAVFSEYARKFSAEIRAAGAQPVLLMTWQRPDSVQDGVTTQNLANAYYRAGAQISAKVAPAGVAFANALSERPQMALYAADGHPTMAGTYLAACVIYATLFEKSPVGISYAPSGMAADDRAFLQRVAAQAAGY
jgi:hypothetical protein